MVLGVPHFLRQNEAEDVPACLASNTISAKPA